MQAVIIADEKQDKLAKRIVEQADLPLLESQTVRFADSEMRVAFDDPLALLPESHAIIVHSTSRPVHDNFVWLFLACHALKAAQVKKITAVIPYLGYVRQNTNPDGTHGAAHMVAHLIEQMGIERLITVALHAPEVASFFSIPVHNITLERFIGAFFQQRFARDELTIIAPDKGAMQRVQLIAEQLSAPTMVFKKERYAVNKTRVVASEGACNTPHAVIVDDIIDTGSTIINVAQELYSSASCSVNAFGIHPVLSFNAPDSLQNSVFKEVWATNTIQLSTQQEFKKLNVLDMSAEIVKVIQEVI